MKKITLQDYQKNPIHVYIYEPETKIKGVIHIIHGISEHFARYGVFAEYMNDHGYLVIGCDIIGHGLSAKTYDYVHFDDKNGDILAYESVLLVKEYIEKNYPDKPVHLLGHSMGSFIARKLIIDFPDDYDRVILTGTMYRSPLLSNIACLLIDIIKIFKGPRFVSPLIQDISIDGNPKRMRKEGLITGLNEEWLTRDKEIQQYYHSSNMCGQPITIEANKNMLKWISFINSKKNMKLGNKAQKIYIMSGAVDPLSNYGKEITKLYNTLKKLGYENVKMKLWKDCHHEILNELDKEAVFQEVVKFLDK